MLYLRKQQEIVIESGNWPFPSVHYYDRWVRGRWLDLPSIHQHIVGFCGKIYPVWEMSWVRRGEYSLTVNKPTFCFTFAEVDDFIRAKAKSTELEEYEVGRKKRVPEKHWNSALRKYRIEEYFAKCESQQNDFEKVFIEHHCPVFVARFGNRNDKSVLVVNGNLKEVEFFRLFGTQTAFQEIAMYFGGLAVPLKEVPEISDKIMVGAKGFDKWSFRKEPKH